MPDVTEEAVCNALLKYKGTGRIDIEGVNVEVSLNPVDIHSFDSPDCLLWIYVSLNIFDQELRLRIPIPVEAEKGGIYGGALEDLKKFVERGKYAIEIPMLVVSEAGYEDKVVPENLPVTFSVHQIPVRAISEQPGEPSSD